MPWFEYKAQTPGGVAITGRLEAADQETARRELDQLKLSVIELEPGGHALRSTASLNADEFLFFNQQLAGLARAGLALDEGLAQLARDVRGPRLRHWIEALAEDLRRGVPLDQAVAARESGLPVLYSRIIRAGLQTGTLPIMLLNLNQHLKASGTTRRIVWEAVSYPLVLAILGLGVASFFFLTIVPQFVPILRDFNTTLPALTVFVLSLAEHFTTLLIVLGALVATVALTWWGLRFSRAGNRLRERVILLLPALGGLHRSSLIARFLKAVALSVEGGIPFPQAIRLSSEATGSELLQSDAERVAAELEAGGPLIEATRSTRIIPPMFGYCAHTAASRGNLPTALLELAGVYDERVTQSQGLLRVFLLPLFVLIIGSIVMFLIVATFLPLVSLINSVSAGC